MIGSRGRSRRGQPSPKRKARSPKPVARRPTRYALSTANVTVAKAEYNPLALVDALKKAGFGGEITG